MSRESDEGTFEENLSTSLKTSLNFIYGLSRDIKELSSSLPWLVYNEGVKIVERFTNKTLTYFQAYLATNTDSSIRTINWLIDLGCIYYIYYDMASFTNYSSYRIGIIIVDGVIM